MVAMLKVQVSKNGLKANVIKYVSRHKHKDKPLEDLEKAKWYIDREIQKLRKKSE